MFDREQLVHVLLHFQPLQLQLGLQVSVTRCSLTNLEGGFDREAAGDLAVFLVEGQNHRWVHRYPRHRAAGGCRRDAAVDLLQVVGSSRHFASGVFQQGDKRLPGFVGHEVPTRLQPGRNPELEAQSDSAEHVADLSVL